MLYAYLWLQLILNTAGALFGRTPLAKIVNGAFAVMSLLLMAFPEIR